MKICYFGIYNPEFSRNKIYQKGLRENDVEIIDCSDRSSGFKKYWNLWKKHREIKNDYDAMVVGYPGHIITPFAKLLSSKKVVLDALCSLYEGEIISRNSAEWWSPKRLKIWLIDFFAYKCADLVLLETDSQVDFISSKFFVDKNKCLRVFTSADDSIFYKDSNIQKRANFTVLFRGQFLPEAGVDTILHSAKILEKENIDFLVMGGGFLKKEMRSLAEKLDLKKVSFIEGFLPFDEIRNLMLSCHVSLGQFGANPRLERTIPHKAFETISMGLPYISGRTKAVLELFTDRQNCLMVRLADVDDLAQKILELRDNPELAQKIGDGGMELFESKLQPKFLAKQILDKISQI
ncbi:MAG: glycosyltransferase [bacterium]